MCQVGGNDPKHKTLLVFYKKDRPGKPSDMCVELTLRHAPAQALDYVLQA